MTPAWLRERRQIQAAMRISAAEFERRALRPGSAE
jgi:hypothetical protein